MGDREDEAACWRRHMQRGEMSEAWAIGDAIIAREGTWRNLSPHRHLRPVWRGQPVEGRSVLVRCHHGLGDTIQFARYIPRLAEVTSALTLAVQAPLLPLLEHLRARAGIVELEEADRFAAYDVEVEITELPHLFRDTLATIPAEVPYLHAKRSGSRPAASGELLVGLVHQAGDWDDRRSIPPQLLSHLGGLPGATLFDLQPHSRRIYIPEGFGLPEGERELPEVARLFKSLDLLVTVDTMAAHLAGALAVPTWTLLHIDPDWRWLEGRPDSPWYPSMRLYRQEEPGDWVGVLRRVRKELEARVREPAGLSR